MRTSRIVLVLAAVAAATGAGAQERGFDHVFSAPGARSTGLGGAFAAIADDATAAYANPAGLVQLLRPELSAELRISGGNITEDEDDYNADVTGLGFLSGVLPLGRWTLAAYGHQVVKNELLSEPLTEVLTPAFEVDRWAVAAAVRLSDTFSVGAGLSYFDGELTGAGIAEEGSDDLGVNAGLLWSPAWWLNLGAFYREGAELEFRTAGAAANDLRLALPDVAGAGFALRPGRGHWTIGFEWDRVLESSLVLLADGSARTLDAGAGDELHLGFEYAALEWSPVTAFRAGLWRQAERPQTGPGPTPRGATVSGDDLHYAAGFGFAWRHAQLDVGFDYADVEVTLSASVIVSF